MNNYTTSIHTFSHEIKNSVTLIYSQLQYIEQIHEELCQDQHWNHMKKDFLQLFAYLKEPEQETNSEISPTLEAIDLPDLFDEIKQSWHHQFQTYNIKFLVHMNPKEHFYIQGSKTKLLQIFHNLISNSVKAIKQKKETLRSPYISIHLTKEAHYLVCNISDNGIGMTKEQLSRAFYRGVSFCPSGNGIGLHVVDKLAKELNIKLQADSTFQQGTTFTLIFSDAIRSRS